MSWLAVLKTQRHSSCLAAIATRLVNNPGQKALPMPNFFYMINQFVHLTSLVVWVGGIIIIGSIVAPVIFMKVESREFAGEVVGDVLARFEKIVLVCIVCIFITSVIKYVTWENPTPWILGRYITITLMTVTFLYSSFYISPKMRNLKKQFSFDIPEGKNPLRKEFGNLHGISVVCMFITGLMGLLTIFLS